MIYLNISKIMMLLALCMFSFYNELDAQDIAKGSVSDSLISIKDTLQVIDDLEIELKKLELNKKHAIAFYDSIFFQLKSELGNVKNRKKREGLLSEMRVCERVKKTIEKAYLLNKKDLMAKYQLQSNDSILNSSNNLGK